jgi:hypothetical protein
MSYYPGLSPQDLKAHYEIDHKLREYGARTSGTIFQKQERLQRFIDFEDQKKRRNEHVKQKKAAESKVENENDKKAAEAKVSIGIDIGIDSDEEDAAEALIQLSKSEDPLDSIKRELGLVREFSTNVVNYLESLSRTLNRRIDLIHERIDRLEHRIQKNMYPIGNTENILEVSTIDSTHQLNTANPSIDYNGNRSDEGL